MSKIIAVMLFGLGTACAVDDAPDPDRRIVAGAHVPITPQPVGCTVDVDAKLAELFALADAYEARGETRELRAAADALMPGQDGWRFFSIPSHQATQLLAPAIADSHDVQVEHDLQASMTASELAAHLAAIDAIYLCEVFGGSGSAKPSAGAGPGAPDTVTTTPMTLISVLAAQLAAASQGAQPAPATTPQWPTIDWPTGRRSEWDNWSFEPFECGGGSGGALWRQLGDSGCSLGVFACEAPWAGPGEYAGGLGLKISL